MPIQPNDRYQQDPERLWRAAEAAGRFPAQARYHGARATSATEALPWAELNKLPAGRSSRRGLNTR
ncbi:DNA repair protein [Micromonospora acroterricola]|uniref:DNA repair protein n=1 Tax=Micromonospora acroterricola TaxID=2202421 RepID=A0A317D1E2_9ACTN|nr:DNA repair protein [Micromonospora acroterricola]PWR08688.1 DNA repair protein [Micromonospora acroterricola]